MGWIATGPTLAGAGTPALPAERFSSPEAQVALAASLETERFRGWCGDMVAWSGSLLDASRAADDPQLSFALARLAVQAAPDDPRPHAEVLKLSLFQQPSIGLAAHELGEVLRTLFADPWFVGVGATTLAAAIGLGAMLVGLFLLAHLLPRHGPCLLHDFRDAFPKRLRHATPVAFLILATAAFFGAGVGPATMVFGLALAMLPYAEPRARWSLALSVAIFAAGWIGIDHLSRLAEGPGQQAWALYRVHKGDSGADLEAALAKGGGERDPDVLLARSALARRAGRYDQASGLLRAAVQAGADEGLARVELGNIHFLQEQLSEAAAEYTQAATLRPKDAVPWINLHVLYLRRLELAEADKALEAARALDARIAEGIQRSYRRGRGSLLPLGAPLGARRIVEQLLLEGATGNTWADRLAGALFLPPLHGKRPVLLGLGALFVALLAGQAVKGRSSRRCPSCGAVVCPRCTRRIKGAEECGGCWALRSEGTTGASERERQREAAALWRDREGARARIGRVAVPGWSEFLQNGSPFELGIGVLWGLSGGVLLLGILYPLPPLPWGGQVVFVVPWLLVVLCHLHGVRRAAAVPRRARGRR